MAEIWPRLKKKFACDVRRRTKSSKAKKANSNASSGLEKLLHGVPGKKTSSSVERTGASVCVARSWSRSTQKWTASTVARTAGRLSESQEGSKSPEVVLSHYSVRPSEAQTRSSEYTECCAFSETGFEARVSNPESIQVKKSRSESEYIMCESESPSVRNLHRDLGNLSEEIQSQGNNFTKEQVRPSPTLCVALPVKTSRSIKKTRSSGWRQTSNSAFVVLVALSAFISSRFGEVGNPVAAVIRIWRRGKFYAKFMFSSVALYFLTPLQSYVNYCPKRLCLLSRKLKVITDTQSNPSTDDASRKLGIEVPHEGRSSGLEISVLPAPSATIKRGAPLSLLVTVPESSTLAEASSASSSIESVPTTVIYKKSGPSRRLAKKLASRFKKLKIFRSSSSQSSVSLLSVSECSLSSPPSGTHFIGSSEPGRPSSPSRPDKHQKCSFSRLHKSKSDICSEVTDFHGESAACTNDRTATSRCAAAEEATDASRNNVSWPGVGLLVALLFLLVGRLPAIVATSLFLLVVSNAHRDRAHPRGRGRETRALEAARKLHRSSPPRHPGSPPRRN